jgi:hypothetical protein
VNATYLVICVKRRIPCSQTRPRIKRVAISQPNIPELCSICPRLCNVPKMSSHRWSAVERLYCDIRKG